MPIIDTTDRNVFSPFAKGVNQVELHVVICAAGKAVQAVEWLHRGGASEGRVARHSSQSGVAFHLDFRSTHDAHPQQGIDDRHGECAVEKFSNGATSRDLGDEHARERRPGDPPAPVEDRPVVHPAWGFQPVWGVANLRERVGVETNLDYPLQVVAKTWRKPILIRTYIWFGIIIVHKANSCSAVTRNFIQAFVMYLQSWPKVLWRYRSTPTRSTPSWARWLSVYTGNRWGILISENINLPKSRVKMHAKILVGTYIFAAQRASEACSSSYLDSFDCAVRNYTTIASRPCNHNALRHWTS